MSLARKSGFPPDARWLNAERARVYVRILCGAQGLALLGLALTSSHGMSRNGEPLGTDFISFWTAARLALAGAPSSAYDPAAHHAAEQAFFGAPVDWYAFFYPPVFLAFCLPLALLPYVAALSVWLAATGFAYVRALRLAVGDRIGVLPMLAFPGVFTTIGHGQNALLSTALFSAGAACLGARPLLAGALYGGLCYKPQLALIIPLALAVGGRWRALFAMAATALVLAGLSLALFGPAAWRAFLAEAPLARATMEQGWVEPEKMASAFAAVRLLGGGVTLAYAVQAVLSAGVCLMLVMAIRKIEDARAQGALAAAAALLVTPFVLDYDLTLLALPMAFLLAQALQTEFRPWEKIVLLAAFTLPAVSRTLAHHAHLPLAPLVNLALFAVLARRVIVKAGANCDSAESQLALDSFVFASFLRKTGVPFFARCSKAKEPL